MVSNPFIMPKEFPPLVSIGQNRTLAIVYPHIQPKLEKYLKICQWLVEAIFFLIQSEQFKITQGNI